METTTDINEDLRTLAQDAENARLYGSPPDAIVLRAIELGMGTRAELRRSTGFGYDVIEKCLERLSDDISFQMVGQIERFHVIGKEPKAKVEYICVDCKGPRSYGSGQRCKRCYDARVAQREIDEVAKNGNKPKGPLHVELGPEEEAVVAAMRDEDEFTKEGFTESLQKVSAKSPRNFEVFDPRRGATYKELDLVEVENLMATEETMAEAAKKLGMTTAQLSVRRQKDDAVAAAVDRGRGRYYDGLPSLNADTEDDEPTESEKNITETITEMCFCGREARHRGHHKGGAPNRKAENGQDTVKVETKSRTEIAQPKPVEVVEPDKKQGKMLDVKMTPQQFIERFNSFDDVEIDEFFTLMNETSAVDNVVWGVLPEEPKHSKQFFSVAYNVLVTMLDDEMSADQKHSVWTLICYLKKQQKNVYG